MKTVLCVFLFYIYLYMEWEKVGGCECAVSHEWRSEDKLGLHKGGVAARTCMGEW